jgi:hypothetical protein
VSDLSREGANSAAGEKFTGPKIEVPRALERYWAWVKPPAGGRGYRFDNLGRVETLRFVEPRPRPIRWCLALRWRSDDSRKMSSIGNGCKPIMRAHGKAVYLRVSAVMRKRHSYAVTPFHIIHVQ